jgi:prevent-host-death family protein
MATDIPQRELRNRTADLLRRVEAGERLRITVHGHPVAELVPIEEELPPRTFVPLKEVMEGLAGTLHPDDRWAEEIRELRNSDRLAQDPFEAYEEKRAEERSHDAAEDG